MFGPVFGFNTRLFRSGTLRLLYSKQCRVIRYFCYVVILGLYLDRSGHNSMEWNTEGQTLLTIVTPAAVYKKCVHTRHECGENVKVVTLKFLFSYYLSCPMLALPFFTEDIRHSGLFAPVSEQEKIARKVLKEVRLTLETLLLDL